MTEPLELTHAADCRGVDLREYTSPKGQRWVKCRRCRHRFPIASTAPWRAVQLGSRSEPGSVNVEHLREQAAAFAVPAVRMVGTAFDRSAFPDILNMSPGLAIRQGAAPIAGLAIRPGNVEGSSGRDRVSLAPFPDLSDNPGSIHR